MRLFTTAAVFNLVLSIGILRPAAAAPTAVELQNSFASVAEKAKPAVVNISVISEQRVRVQEPYFFFGDPEDMFRGPKTYRYRQQGTGSGFIIDPKGYAITNEHVIRGATEIKVTLTQANGKDRTFSGRVVGRDPNIDLAVIKIVTNENLPFVKFADDAPRVGDWAIAIGSPFALQQSLTVGVVSALRQSLQIEGRRYLNVIQTDAAINQGNSGGPLLNIKGEVIGVNTAIYSPSGAFAGIGFAIPVSEVKPIMNYMLAGKTMKRGFMGVEAAPVDDVAKRRFALPTAEGALVNAVVPGSPAARAGIKRGDVIRKFDDKDVITPNDLVAMTSHVEAGKKVKLQIYRKGVPMDVHVELGERPDPDQQVRMGRGSMPDHGDSGAADFKWEGVSFAAGDEGVTIADVDSDSKLAGYLLPGDVVRGINAQEVNSIADLRQAVRGVKLSEGIFLDIVRQGQPLYLSVRP